MDADQIVTLKIALAAAILEANVAIAAILFGVLGFVYTVFATFARRERPQTGDIDETTLDLRSHPIIAPLRRVARWLAVSLSLSLIISITCFWWFLLPIDYLLIISSVGLLCEIILMIVIGFYIAFKLMPRYV
jgi:hypothetical protein